MRQFEGMASLKRIFAMASVVAAFALPYVRMRWWTFAIGGVAIVALLRFLEPVRFGNISGLRNRRHWSWWAAMPAFLVSALATEVFIQTMVAPESGHKNSPEIVGWWLAQPIAQTLNEELI